MHYVDLCGYYALLPDLREATPGHQAVLRGLPALCLASFDAWVGETAAQGNPSARGQARQLLAQAAAEASGEPTRWHYLRAFLHEGLHLLCSPGADAA